MLLETLVEFYHIVSNVYIVHADL